MASVKILQLLLLVADLNQSRARTSAGVRVKRERPVCSGWLFAGGVELVSFLPGFLFVEDGRKGEVCKDERGREGEGERFLEGRTGN